MLDYITFGGLALAFATFFAHYIIWSIVSYRRLQSFRGPKWAAWSQTWLFKHTISGTVHLKLRDVSEQYGPLARIGPNVILTDDPVFLRRISAARSLYTKGEWYDGVKLDPDINNTVSEKDERLHNQLRAKVANGYAGKDNPNLEASVDARIQDLITLISEKYLSINGSYHPMDFAHIAQYFTMDVLTDVAFSNPLGFLKQNADLFGYIKTVRAYMPILELKTNIPLINSVLGNPVLRKLMAPTESDIFGLGKMMGVAREMARERFGTDPKVKEDMLGSFVKHGLNQAEAASEALLQIMVGTDSTATAVRCIFYYIITNPQVYRALQQELDQAANSNKITRPVIRDFEARDLPYLQACIAEGLRIWPPVTGLIFKTAPPKGDTYNGVFIPGGTQIGYSAWALHHSKEMYGADADVFRPERWLEAKGEKLESMRRSQELVFGYGKYGCLGKGIAFLELNKVFVEMFLRFDFSAVHPQQGFTSRCNGMFMQSDMHVVVVPRT